MFGASNAFNLDKNRTLECLYSSKDKLPKQQQQSTAVTIEGSATKEKSMQQQAVITMTI